MTTLGTSAEEMAGSVRDSIAVGGGDDDPDPDRPAPQLEDGEDGEGGEGAARQTEPLPAKQKPADVNVDLGHLGKINPGQEAAELVIDERTAAASWFASRRDRRVVKAMAKSILKAGEPGHFLVRDKASDAGSFALTVNAGPSQLMTYLIETRGAKRRFAIMGTTNESFDTMADLIDFYAEEKRGSLEHKLILPGVYLTEVRDKAEEEAAKAPVKEEAYIDVSGAADAPGLPRWLQVDPRIKDAIRNSMRARVKTKGGKGAERPAPAPIGEYLETESSETEAADDGVPSNKAAMVRTEVQRNSANVNEVTVGIETGGFNGAYSAATENGAAGDDAMFDFDQTDKAYDVMRIASAEGPTYDLAASGGSAGNAGNSDQTYDMASASTEANEADPTYELATSTPAYDKLTDGADPEPSSKIYDGMAVPAQNSLLPGGEKADDDGDVYIMANAPGGEKADDDGDIYKMANAQEDEDQNTYLTPSLRRRGSSPSDEGSDVAAADSPERTAPGTAPNRQKSKSRAARLLGTVFKTTPKTSRRSTAGTPMSSRPVSYISAPATPTSPSPVSPPPLRSPSPLPPR